MGKDGPGEARSDSPDALRTADEEGVVTQGGEADAGAGARVVGADPQLVGHVVTPQEQVEGAVAERGGGRHSSTEPDPGPDRLSGKTPIGDLSGVLHLRSGVSLL